MPLGTIYTTFGSTNMTFATACMTFGTAYMTFGTAYMTFSSAHMTFGAPDMCHTNTQLMTSGIPPYEPNEHALFMVSGSMLWKRKNVVLIQFSIFLARACMLNMADDTRKRIEAARLMREAAKLLEESNKQSTGSINERNTSEELQKLFAPYRQTPTNNRQALQEAKPPKAKRQRGWVPMFNPLPTWTHRFCLLSDIDTSIAPNIPEKERLKAMGLGELKITFDDKKGNHQYFTRVLEEKFPLLKNAGGYSICRTASGSQRLQVISPGKSGYSIPYLRDESPLRQAVAYIRPLQKSIGTYSPTSAVEVRFLNRYHARRQEHESKTFTFNGSQPFILYILFIIRNVTKTMKIYQQCLV